MIWNTDYINLYISLRRVLHTKNVEKLPYNKIEHLGKMHREDYFDHYLKSVFFRWMSENSKNTISFYKRANNLSKKLKLTLTHDEQQKIESVLPRELTTRRALKQMEAPYSNLDKAITLSTFAYFNYKQLRVYKREKFLLEKMFKSDVYMSPKELVFFDPVKEKIIKVVRHEDIKGIKLTSYGVEVEINKQDNIYLRYKDNELIYISLDRSISNKSKVDFEVETRDEASTAEKTIESLITLEI